MYVVTPVQMRKIDQRAIDEFGIPGIVRWRMLPSG